MRISFILAIILSLNQLTNFNTVHARTSHNEVHTIKSINGRLYAYIALLFNENPHFVNLIQKDSISPEIIEKEPAKIKEYRDYIKNIRSSAIKKTAQKMLQIYKNPRNYSARDLKNMEEHLLEYNIILRFSRKKLSLRENLTLDYCIFGKKDKITLKHPFLEINETYYNIQPFIYYDEFSTSNSTFYFDMVYINPEEVNNDSFIAQSILKSRPVKSMFFVGSPITPDIHYCLKRAFDSNEKIKTEIWQMFIIHELTHKVINNKFNHYDQINGEILSLCSTVYTNPYLGLAVMYSYLNYNTINPHRIAAESFISYISEATHKPEIKENPGQLKEININKIQKHAQDYFHQILKNLKSISNS